MSDTAVFQADIQTNADEVLGQVAEGLESVRKAAGGALSELKKATGALKETAAAKEGLASVKAPDSTFVEGTEKATKTLKESAKASGEWSKALGAVGGPLADADGKVEKFSKAFDGLSASEVAMVGGAALAAAAIAALVAGVAYGAFEFARFALAAGDAAKAMQNVREAAVGSEAGATALGTQVDALARKIPTAKGELNGLAASLARSGIGGKTLVDAFNAIGQAAAANGQAAGAQIQSLLERGKNLKRFQLGRFDLQGTGLKRDDVAAQLAKNLKGSIGAARQALAEGRVSLADGAEAMRAAVEEKFGAVNAKKMLEFPVIFAKMKEDLQGLGSGVDVTPLAKAFADVSHELSTSTVAGAALKELVTTFGNGIVSVLKDAMPFIKGFFTGLVLMALDLGIAYYDVKDALLDTFGDDLFDGLGDAEDGILAAKVAVGALAAATVLAMGAIAYVVAPVVIPFVAVGAAIYGVVKAVEWLKDKWDATDFGALGTAMVDGLVNGIKDGLGRVKDAVGGLAEGAKDAFKRALGIHSPSREFAKFGEYTAQGYEQGIDKSAPSAQGAVADMVTVPDAPRGASGSAPAGRGGTTINVTINAGGDGGKVASALTEAGFFDMLQRAVERALASESLTAEVAV